MNVSSRTPEGQPNRCAICGNEVIIEPSIPPGDAPCPHCGSLLWFLSDPPAARSPRPEPKAIEHRRKSMTVERFLEFIAMSRLLEFRQIRWLHASFQTAGHEQLPVDSQIARLIEIAVGEKLLTPWQCENLAEGKYKSFFVGRYKLLARLSREAETGLNTWPERSKFPARTVFEVVVANEKSGFRTTIFRDGQVVDEVYTEFGTK